MRTETLGPLAPLAAHHQWVLVQFVPKADGKTDKLPVSGRTGTVCNAHDPAAWMPYADARAVLDQWGTDRFGLGFVLTAADDLWCVDIDNALQPDGKTWSPLAQELCQSLAGTVVEVSRSGRGLHLWGRGPIPEHRKKNVAIGAELYSSLRFVALGSNAVGAMAPAVPGIADVVERYFKPDELAPGSHDGNGPRADWRGPTDDDELIRRALQSQSARSVFDARGASFRDLWERNTGVLARAYPSTGDSRYDESSADAALAAHLAFWAGCDVGRMARLMQRSGLRRDKYERPDYLPRTIAAAIARQRDVLQDKPRADPVATVDPVASRGFLDRLYAIRDADELKAQWLALVLPMDPVTADEALGFVEARLAVGRRALNAEIKKARARAAADTHARSIMERAGSRELIRWEPEASSDIASRIELLILASAAPGDYVQFGGAVSHVTVKRLTQTSVADRPAESAPPVPQIEPLDAVAIRAHVERVAVLFEHNRDTTQRLIGVPDRIVETLLQKSTHAAPSVTGLLSHPVVLPPHGEILAAEGLHAGSGLFLRGLQLPGLRPLAHHEAPAALARLRASFLAEFEFASPLAADLALAALLTGVQRRILDKAPGVALLAAVQASGKTTLAQRLHVVLTGHDMPVSTFPLGNEEEVSKRLLSALLRNPAMVCFDNVPDGYTFHSGALSAAMTGPLLTQRFLGLSRDVTVPTNCLFVLTGNNLSFGNDEVSRWLVVRLAPASARPEERRFRHADTVGYALSVRAAVLSDALALVSGYLSSGQTMPTGSRFPTWDRMVRQPLLWAGASDVAEVFRSNAEESETVRAHRGLLWALVRLFPDGKWFTARDVCVHLMTASNEATEGLRGALDSLPVRDPTSPKSVGTLLKGHIGRAAAIDGRDWALSSRIGRTHMAEFQVTARGA